MPCTPLCKGAFEDVRGTLSDNLSHLDIKEHMSVLIVVMSGVRQL